MPSLPCCCAQSVGAHAGQTRGAAGLPVGPGEVAGTTWWSPLSEEVPILGSTFSAPWGVTPPENLSPCLLLSTLQGLLFSSLGTSLLWLCQLALGWGTECIS